MQLRVDLSCPDCNTMQHTAMHCNSVSSSPALTATHCITQRITLQHTATPCCALLSELQQTATNCNTLQDTATSCCALLSELQHTATHCNTLQLHAALSCPCRAFVSRVQVSVVTCVRRLCHMSTSLCCSVLQCVAVCCSLLSHVYGVYVICPRLSHDTLQHTATCHMCTAFLSYVYVSLMTCVGLLYVWGFYMCGAFRCVGLLYVWGF